MNKQSNIKQETVNEIIAKESNLNINEQQLSNKNEMCEEINCILDEGEDPWRLEQYLFPEHPIVQDDDIYMMNQTCRPLFSGNADTQVARVSEDMNVLLKHYWVPQMTRLDKAQHKQVLKATMA